MAILGAIALANQAFSEEKRAIFHARTQHRPLFMPTGHPFAVNNDPIATMRL
jgi:hypothetical protein